MLSILLLLAFAYSLDSLGRAYPAMAGRLLLAWQILC